LEHQRDGALRQDLDSMASLSIQGRLNAISGNIGSILGSNGVSGGGHLLLIYPLTPEDYGEANHEESPERRSTPD